MCSIDRDTNNDDDDDDDDDIENMFKGSVGYEHSRRVVEVVRILRAVAHGTGGTGSIRHSIESVSTSVLSSSSSSSSSTSFDALLLILCDDSTIIIINNNNS
jgi:hypothetical protein